MRDAAAGTMGSNDELLFQAFAWTLRQLVSTGKSDSTVSFLSLKSVVHRCWHDYTNVSITLLHPVVPGLSRSMEPSYLLCFTLSIWLVSHSPAIMYHHGMIRGCTPFVRRVECSSSAPIDRRIIAHVCAPLSQHKASLPFSFFRLGWVIYLHSSFIREGERFL
jgi:hypothetical protein